MSDLHISITGPSDPAILVLTWCIRVTCGHGVTSLVWRRTCGNGCHRHGPARAARCHRVTPSARLLESAGVLEHALRLGCGCDHRFWMQHGPEHHQVITVWEIQPDERQVTGVAYEELRVSVGTVQGPWDADDGLPIWDEGDDDGGEI